MLESPGLLGRRSVSIPAHFLRPITGRADHLRPLVDLGPDVGGELHAASADRNRAVARHAVAFPLRDSTSTCTPAPGLAFSPNFAPTASARSRMMIRPNPGLEASIRLGSKPTPSSETLSLAVPFVHENAISTQWAFECLATLLSASCAIRNRARSIVFGGEVRESLASNTTWIPVLLVNLVASERSAATNP